MLKRLLIPLSAVCLLVSCGDECSSNSSTQPEFVESSSSLEQEVESSSSEKLSSSSVKASSSSTKQIRASSSSVKGTSSSRKTESSSSQGSSSVKDDKSSASEKNSSSEAQSSSSESSSSGIVTQNSSSSSENPGSIENSSSSEESSSSLNPVESSSSEMSSSSSPALNSIYDAENNTLTDLRDGHVYKTATIGQQVWMAENLNYLPEDTAGTIWAGKSLCGGGEWHTKMEGDCSVYGRLYEEDFTKQTIYIQKICPNGWSLPTMTQYQTLIAFLGDNAVNKMKIEGSNYWKLDDTANNSGFSAIPAGYFSVLGFNDMHDEGISVASFAFLSNGSKARNVISIVDGQTDFWWSSFGDGYYMSVRCIKD